MWARTHTRSHQFHTLENYNKVYFVLHTTRVLLLLYNSMKLGDFVKSINSETLGLFIDDPALHVGDGVIRSITSTSVLDVTKLLLLQQSFSIVLHCDTLSSTIFSNQTQ